MRGAGALMAVVVGAGTAFAGERVAGVMTFIDRDGAKRMVSIPSAPQPKGVPEASSSTRAELLPHVRKASLAQGLDPDLVDLVIRMESGYNARAVSRKGAKGVMQLLPSTARAYGVTDLFDPIENIGAGVRYLRDMLLRFDSDIKLALAAYNAGPEAVEKHGGVPPFEETRNYVSAILSAYGSSGFKLSGGFGKLTVSARPVELVAQGNGTLISNERRAGEPVVARRLALR